MTPNPAPTLTYTRLLPPDAVRVPSEENPASVWAAPADFWWVARVDPTTPGLDALSVVSPLERAVAGRSTGVARVRVTPAPILGHVDAVPLVRHGDTVAPWAHVNAAILAQALDRVPLAADGSLLPVVAHQLGDPTAVIELSAPAGAVWGYLMPVRPSPGALAARFAPIAPIAAGGDR